MTATRKATESFAKSAPRALGRFNEAAEPLSRVREQSGWEARRLRAYVRYYGDEASFPTKHFTEGEDLDQVRMRRRPCDRYTLRADEAHEWEDRNRDYFPFDYDCARKHLPMADGLTRILDLAAQEFGELDFLQPLANVVQTVRRDPRAPFITRCWDFTRSPGALIKTSEFELQDGTRFEGTCICYEPPPVRILAATPANYLIFRHLVGHEIGHAWWHLIAEDRPPGLRAIDAEDQDQIEQIVSLFSVFLIMYRGYWDRRAPTRDELGEAFASLRFETAWAAENEDRILQAVERGEVPTRTFPPGEEATSLPDERPEPPEVELPDATVRAVRNAAADIVARAEPIPFASTAAVIMLRKLDTFVSFEFVEAGEYPRFVATDRVGKHLSLPRVAPSRWREYQMQIPEPQDSRLPFAQYLEVARLLGHIRLHGHRFDGTADKLRSEDLERDCDADARDLARVLALALYRQDGVKRRRRMSSRLARVLLSRDPSQLGYLEPYTERYFHWCSEDPDCPEADDRFLAEVRHRYAGEVHLDFWGEDGRVFTTTLASSLFEENGFRAEDLQPGLPFKLFGIERERRLKPVPIDRQAAPAGQPSPLRESLEAGDAARTRGGA